VGVDFPEMIRSLQFAGLLVEESSQSRESRNGESESRSSESESPQENAEETSQSLWLTTELALSGKMRLL
jgi:hypothetical protein